LFLVSEFARLLPQLRLASLAENSFNAVERVDEFSHVPPEGGGRTAVTPAPDFPPAGKITFTDVALRYRPSLPFVLKHLSFTIPPGTQVRRPPGFALSAWPERFGMSGAYRAFWYA
jgi:ABC-type multidrug transport system fused ATPase/permease subunit